MSDDTGNRPDAVPELASTAGQGLPDDDLTEAEIAGILLSQADPSTPPITAPGN